MFYKQISIRSKVKKRIKIILLFIVLFFFLSSIFNISVLFFLIPFLFILLSIIKKNIILLFFANKILNRINHLSFKSKILYLTNRKLLPSFIFRYILVQIIENQTLDISNSNLNDIMKELIQKNNSKIINKFFQNSLRALAKANLSDALTFGKQYYNTKQIGIMNDDSLKCYLIHLNKAGMFLEAKKILQLVRKKNKWYYNYKLIINNQINLLNNGLLYGDKMEKPWQPKSRTVLYHTSHSLPYVQSGYAYRTHWLLNNIIKKNWDIQVCNRVGFPNDRHDFKKSPIIPKDARLDSIIYKMECENNELFPSNIKKYHELSVQTLIKQCSQIQPSIIHAASNHTCGLAATDAAQRLGIKSIYEIRGLWHFTRASKEEGYSNSNHFNLINNLEIQAAKNANHVFVITEAIKNILINKGLDNNKITILPNGVDINRFPLLKEKKIELMNKYDINNQIIIGYIGSIVVYEGLDYLVQSIKKIINQGIKNIKLIIVGDGDYLPVLKEQVINEKLFDYVIFTGRVSHLEINNYYSIMDFMVYPRKGYDVCEIVSPLKPYEAMASGKPIIVSNVNALSEMIENNETGLLHQKDDVNDLSQKIIQLIDSKDMRMRLSQAGYKWVMKNRTWDLISNKVTDVYNNLLS
tara:strand:+ start:3626 stop:5539 length:1914 start_codon:yes stop_codon:yes gene_type:complete